jgi:hypothetical protein
VIAADGMSVDSTFTPESRKHSKALERSWDSMSASAPSWLLGKRWNSNWPPVSALTCSAALLRWTLRGCDAGTFVPILKVCSAAWA